MTNILVRLSQELDRNVPEERTDQECQKFRDFLAALITRAILDAFGLYSKEEETHRVNWTVADEARDWIFCDDLIADQGLTFLECCDALDLSASAIRAKVSGLINSGLPSLSGSRSQIQEMFGHYPGKRKKARYQSWGYWI